MKQLAVFLFITAALLAADKPNIAGDWYGTLKTPGPQLRLALHLQPVGDGWKGTLDSLDQNANGIPIASVQFTGNELKLDVQAVNGSYLGKVSADSKSILGTWTQGGDMPLTFTREPAKALPNSPSAALLLGVWEGTLNGRSQSLRLRFTLTKTGKGEIDGKVDSIDQGANGMPIVGMTLDGDKFHFDLPAVGGKYDGTVSKDRKSISGTWSQSGNQLPLEWKLVEKTSNP